MKIFIPILLLAALAPALASAQAPATTDKTAEQVRVCSRANLPEASMAQSVEIEISERSGTTRSIEADIFLKRFADDETRGTLQVDQPADVKGVSYLWVDRAQSDQLFLYLPSLQRVRRVTGQTAANSLLGSDFSYEDIKYLRGITAGGEDEGMTTAEVGQRPAYRLSIAPAPVEQSVYQRVVFYIDQQTCVPLQIELFADTDIAVKRLTADTQSLQQIGTRWLARKLTMRDITAGTQSVLTVTGVEFDDHINDAVFNQRGFYQSAYVPKSDIPPAQP